ncbi:MAG: diacylglycerol kinase family protein [Oscillospiraceae bacterium]|jgi:hypothetical protein
MKTGVLANADSGTGRAVEVCREISKVLRGTEIYSAAGFGAELIEGSTAVPYSGDGYVDRIRSAAREVALKAPDLMIAAGGDGFASYIADALITSGGPVPRMIGIGCGTENIGPIAAFHEMPEHPETLQFREINAVEVLESGRHISYAFNDIVFGNTYLTTLDGKVITADARDLWKNGRKTPCEALDDIGKIEIEINRRPCPVRLEKTAQIIVSPLRDGNLRGRAVTGIFCYVPGSRFGAGLIASERALVSFADSRKGVEEPLMIEQLIFSESDVIRIKGLRPGISAVCDGNPFGLEWDPTVVFRRNVIEAAADGG